MIWGLKCHQNNSPVVCDGYVKYEEAEVDGLVVKVVWNTVSSPPRQGLLKYIIFLKLGYFHMTCGGIAGSKLNLKVNDSYNK